MENIASRISLPTLQKINLRQGSVPLSFVAIANSATSAAVSIDTNGVEIGAYTLELESIDSSSSNLQEVLKKDTVTIYVTEYIRYLPVVS